MTIEELEEQIHEVLDGAVWLSVSLRRWNGNRRWLLSINGKDFPVESKQAGMRYLSLFFLKAAEMDVASE